MIIVYPFCMEHQCEVHLLKILVFLVELEGVPTFGFVDSPPMDSQVPVDSRVR